MNKIFRNFALAALCTLPTLAAADLLDDIVDVELLPGWREADGTHVAAISVKMAPGWHTYWRYPGDVGVPPVFDWSKSRNLDNAKTHWPVPTAWKEGNALSIGYKEDVIFPVRLDARADRLALVNLELHMGICAEICIPATFKIRGVLPKEGRMDPAIMAALESNPMDTVAANATYESCVISQADDAVTVSQILRMPAFGTPEVPILEIPNDGAWVSRIEHGRDDDLLLIRSTIKGIPGTDLNINGDDFRLSVFADGKSVEVAGCL